VGYNRLWEGDIDGREAEVQSMQRKGKVSRMRTWDEIENSGPTVSGLLGVQPFCTILEKDYVSLCAHPKYRW